MSIIILEGENKTGKSTLAGLLHEKTGYQLYKSSQPVKPPYYEYMEMLDEIGEGNAIIDRFHIGELVYGPLYRGESKLSKKEFEEIEHRLLKLGTILIYCYDDASRLARRFRQEKEEFASTNKIQKTLRLYNDVLRNTKLPIIKHKMESDNDLTRLIIKI